MTIINIKDLNIDYHWAWPEDDEEGFVVADTGSTDPFVEFLFMSREDAQEWIDWWVRSPAQLMFSGKYTEDEIAKQAARVAYNHVGGYGISELVDLRYTELLEVAFGLNKSPEKSGRQNELLAHSMLVDIVYLHADFLTQCGYDVNEVVDCLDELCDEDLILPKSE